MKIQKTLSAVLLAACALFAQSDRGTLTGTVTDPASAVVPAAKVTLKNSETGAVYETVTTPTGNYTISSLPIGAYNLTIEAPWLNGPNAGISQWRGYAASLDVLANAAPAAGFINVLPDPDGPRRQMRRGAGEGFGPADPPAGRPRLQCEGQPARRPPHLQAHDVSLMRRRSPPNAKRIRFIPRPIMRWCCRKRAPRMASARP